MQGVNQYDYTFDVKCPRNGETVEHHLTIMTNTIIFVEDIVEFFDGVSMLHEELADEAYKRFGGEQEIEAVHHGVVITTLRGTPVIER